MFALTMQSLGCEVQACCPRALLSVAKSFQDAPNCGRSSLFLTTLKGQLDGLLETIAEHML